MLPELSNPHASPAAAPRPAPLRALLWGLCGGLVGMLVQGLVLSLGPPACAWDLPLALLPLHGLAVVAALAGLLQGVPRAQWAACCGLERFPAAAVRQTLIVGLWALPLLALLQAGLEALWRRAGLPVQTAPGFDLLQGLHGPGTWTLALGAFLIWVPLAEEVLFRLVLTDALSGAGLRWAWLASAALFALAHGSLPQSLALFVLALVLQRLRTTTGGLWAPVLAHALVNGIALIQWAR